MADVTDGPMWRVPAMAGAGRVKSIKETLEEEAAVSGEAKWSIRKSKDGQFYPVAVGGNGEVLVTGRDTPTPAGRHRQRDRGGLPGRPAAARIRRRGELAMRKVIGFLGDRVQTEGDSGSSPKHPYGDVLDVYVAEDGCLRAFTKDDPKHSAGSSDGGDPEDVVDSGDQGTVG